MNMQKMGFQAEVSRLLDIVAHSLYSDRAVFLRELVSNASDACDKLRYLSLTEPGLLGEDRDFKITVAIDKAAKTLTISDNGIGMNRDELADNLGTIARSGTQGFTSQLSGDAAKDVKLIGQFGVGFYSTFMVAQEVEVISRRAGAPSPANAAHFSRSCGQSPPAFASSSSDASRAACAASFD